MAAPKNPVGAKSDKLWRDAIMRAVRRTAEGDAVQALERLADKLVALALQGDSFALKEIGDRLDGRPHQVVIPQNADGSVWHSMSDEELQERLNERLAEAGIPVGGGANRGRTGKAPQPDRLH